MSKKEDMFALVSEWVNSGLSIKSFSKQNGISYYSFDYWQRKYKNEILNLSKLAQEKQKINFIKIDPSLSCESSKREVQIEMDLPSGIQIKIY